MWFNNVKGVSSHDFVPTKELNAGEDYADLCVHHDYNFSDLKNMPGKYMVAEGWTEATLSGVDQRGRVRNSKWSVTDTMSWTIPK